MSATGSVAGNGRRAGWGSSHRVAEAGVLLVVVAWAANFIVVKAANTEIPPIAFALIRFALAASVLLLILRWREGSARMPWPAARPILLLGAVGFGAYQLLWATGLQAIPAGDSAFLIAATPVFTALISVRAGSDTLTAGKLGGALLSFAGVGIVVASGPGLGLGGSLVGYALTLGAAGCWAVYSSYGAPVLASYSSLRTTAWAMLGGTLVLLPIGLWQVATLDWSAVHLAAWAGLAYSSFIPAGLANVVVFHGIRLLGPTRITALQVLVPFVAVLMGAAFLGERIQPGQIVGGAVIVAGVLLTRGWGRAFRGWAWR